jgi:hypothetical protein
LWALAAQETLLLTAQSTTAVTAAQRSLLALQLLVAVVVEVEQIRRQVTVEGLAAVSVME